MNRRVDWSEVARGMARVLQVTAYIAAIWLAAFLTVLLIRVQNAFEQIGSAF